VTQGSKDEVIRQLIQEFEKDPGNTSVRRRLDRLAWEAFHDPWEEGPRRARKGESRPRTRVLAEELAAGLSDEGRHALELLGRTLEALEIPHASEADGVTFDFADAESDSPVIRVRARVEQEDVAETSVVLESQWILPVATIGIGKVFKVCNRFNRDYRVSRAFVVNHKVQESTTFGIGCRIPVSEERDVETLISLVCYLKADAWAFTSMVRQACP